MKKEMKRKYIFVILIALIIMSASFILKNMTGKVVGSDMSSGDSNDMMQGPTDEQITCMETCSGCTYGDAMCMEQHSTRCGAECNVETSGPPAPENEGEKCMQECVVQGCEKYDFMCEKQNKVKCEDECEMKGDAPDESEMNEEQLCISKCVAAEDQSVICGSSQEGETGNTLCRRCASECVHLYEGPCLDDEQIKEKEKECENCEHCYGGPVMGASGEGWDCIVDIECKDASSEFGDEPGEGPGIGQEGYVAPNPIAKTVDRTIKFFKRIFGGEKNNQEDTNS